MCTMDAFGNVLQTGDSYSGYLPDSAGSGGGYHLTTKEFDADSGLYYFGARWYDPVTGRFVSREPLLSGIMGLAGLASVGCSGLGNSSYFHLAMIDPQRWNAYSFCVGNPVVYVDPDGQWPVLVGPIWPWPPDVWKKLNDSLQQLLNTLKGPPVSNDRLGFPPPPPFEMPKKGLHGGDPDTGPTVPALPCRRR